MNRGSWRVATGQNECAPQEVVLYMVDILYSRVNSVERRLGVAKRPKGPKRRTAFETSAVDRGRQSGPLNFALSHWLMRPDHSSICHFLSACWFDRCCNIFRPPPSTFSFAGAHHLTWRIDSQFSHCATMYGSLGGWLQISAGGHTDPIPLPNVDEVMWMKTVTVSCGGWFVPHAPKRIDRSRNWIISGNSRRSAHNSRRRPAQLCWQIADLGWDGKNEREREKSRWLSRFLISVRRSSLF